MAIRQLYRSQQFDQLIFEPPDQELPGHGRLLLHVHCKGSGVSELIMGRQPEKLWNSRYPLRRDQDGYHQCCGSVTLRTSNPAPDPSIFVSNLQDDKKIFFVVVWFLLFEATFIVHDFFKDKVIKTS